MGSFANDFSHARNSKSPARPDRTLSTHKPPSTPPHKPSAPHLQPPVSHIITSAATLAAATTSTKPSASLRTTPHRLRDLGEHGRGAPGSPDLGAPEPGHVRLRGVWRDVSFCFASQPITVLDPALGGFRFLLLFCWKAFGWRYP